MADEENPDVEFTVYRDFMGEMVYLSGPMEIGGSITANCKQPGDSKFNAGR